VTPTEALAGIAAGRRLPVYLVVGSERYLKDRVVTALREACLAGGVVGFNEDKFTAGEGDVERVISACRTAPMMAKARFILCRNVDRWDRASSEDSDDDSKKAAPLDLLFAYAKGPIPSSCLVLVGEKLDGRRKLSALAKSEDFVVNCEPLDSRALLAFVKENCRKRGNPIDDEMAEFLAEIAGPELGHVEDAIERLSLFAGLGNAIDEAAISECVVRVRKDDTWALVEAVGTRDLPRALKTLADCYDPRDRGLPLLGALAWSLRQLLKFVAATEAGASEGEAAKKAGVFQPFRARELGQKARRFRGKELERILLALADADRALKGSKRPPEEILHELVIRLCGTAPARVPATGATSVRR
jgi:DNA polymerase-3 subunit delta